MPQWKEFKREEVDGVLLVVDERTDSRNQLGAIEYNVKAHLGGQLVHHERVPWNVWAGHCSGQLLLPQIAARAKLVAAHAHTNGLPT